MSKHEIPMVRWYWTQVGGTLIEEFCAVRSSNKNGPRYMDAIIIEGGDRKILKKIDIADIKGKDIILVQAKTRRLNLPLLGQAFFSAKLMKRFKPRSIESVALCSKNDEVLRPMFESYPNMKVVVYRAFEVAE